MSSRALPGVSGVGGHIGRAITSDQVVGNSSAELWVSIDQNANFSETEQAVRDVVQGYPGIAHNVPELLCSSRSAICAAPLEPGFAVRVYGTELPVLREKAEEVRKALENINGVKNPKINATTRRRSWRSKSTSRPRRSSVSSPVTHGAPPRH